MGNMTADKRERLRRNMRFLLLSDKCGVTYVTVSD